jgi:uncharacterized protein with PQ loop repeat
VIELCGLIATCCFAISAIPQAWRSYREGHSNGLAWPTVVLWFIGEVCMLVYVGGLYGLSDMYLLVNYVVNTVTCGTILWFKAFPRK